VEDGTINEFTRRKAEFWAELANDLASLWIINHSDWFWAFGPSNLNELAKSISFFISASHAPA
jgi:hypothetical protein